VTGLSGSTDVFEDIFMRAWRPYAWIAAAIILLYSKSLWFGYTYLDDHLLIMKNHDFIRDLSNAGAAFFQKVFPKSYLPYYRPVLILSFMFDARLADNSLFVYHATNIAIHIAASGLVFLFLTKLGYGRELSFFFSAIFAVHPVLSQGVAWIPGRNDTLLAVFALASFIFFMEFLKSGKAMSYVWSLLFFVVALFTKETALVLIFMFIIYMHTIAAEKLFSPRGRLLAAGWLAAAMAWWCVRENAMTASKTMNVYEMGSLIVAYLPAALQFLGKIFFPFNLSVFPIIADTTFGYGAAAAALVAAALVFTKPKRYKFMLFGASWAILFLLPSLIRANTKFAADFIEHRLYVPIIGCIILLCETHAVRALERHKTAMRTFAIAVILVFSAITFRHIDNFADRFAFWRNAVTTSPHSSFAHMALGIACHDNAMIDEAAAEYGKCLALDPLEPGSRYGLGDIYLRKGMIGKAEQEMKKTIAVYPGHENAYLALGVMYYRSGRLKEAEEMWKRAISINPDNARAYKDLAIYYYELKEYQKAADCVRRLREMGLQVPGSFLRSLAAAGKEQPE